MDTNQKNQIICPINPTKYHKNRKMKNCLSAILDCPSLDHKKQPKHKDSQDLGSLQINLNEGTLESRSLFVGPNPLVLQLLRAVNLAPSFATFSTTLQRLLSSHTNGLVLIVQLRQYRREDMTFSQGHCVHLLKGSGIICRTIRT
ncbi:hypothetical protein PROFUN_08217 [Planoprotostelium fungivorum]|uniref:Uncharacterized protein n=1 Tax=Planoprotostelium fungivorum TaxID=1890364 RepID=A0A2P6N672_9EUKA|nr:hypothetical protein PROFUN_08217 [Planoprotostelium fungivorum]